MVSSIHFLHYIVSAYLRQVKFAFCCDFLYFRSANIYSPKKGARCCNKSLTSSVLSFVVMYKRGVVMFGVVSLTMGNSCLPARNGLTGYVQSRRQSFLRQPGLFPAKRYFGSDHPVWPPFDTVYFTRNRREMPPCQLWISAIPGCTRDFSWNMPRKEKFPLTSAAQLWYHPHNKGE